MSKFTDIKFEFENPSLKQIYTETNQEERKQRVLKLYKKKYWDAVFNETEKIFKIIISKNYKKEKKFFDEVRKIKEHGIDFFEKLLDLNIPKRYNTLFFSQIVMNKEEIYNCETEFLENWHGSFALCIKEPYIVIREYVDEEGLKCNVLNELTFRLGCDQPFSHELGFKGCSKNHTEKDFWTLYNVEDCHIDFDIYDNYEYYMKKLNLEQIFLQ